MTPATLASTQSRNENVLAICRLLGAVALKEGVDVTALFAGSAFQGCRRDKRCQRVIAKVIDGARRLHLVSGGGV
jgi:hypothetical protein